MKSGIILLVGRPNVGKSTLVNNIIGQKVAITSPKPQTTRFPILARFEEERGTATFVDTPGIFLKAHDTLSQKINKNTLQTLNREADLVLYVVDQSRKRDREEGRVLGIVRKINKPKILVINKIDKEGSFLPQYKFLEDEFENVVEISARHSTNLKELVNKIFELLPESSEKTASDQSADESIKSPYPLLNVDANTFIAELIREKVFLMTGEEIPYTTTAIVDEIKERSKTLTYIKARILTTDDRYKRMLIGTEGRKIKEIGAYARKEIALATNRKIFLDLSVEVDPHWIDAYL